jgi:hypothetical protein
MTQMLLINTDLLIRDYQHDLRSVQRVIINYRISACPQILSARQAVL